MIPVPTGVRVWLATGHTDMRKGFASLSLQVQEILKRDPLSGQLFCFRGQPLGKQARALAVMPDHLQEIAAASMRRWNHIRRDLQAKTVSRPRSDARFPADGASRSRRAGNRA